MLCWKDIHQNGPTMKHGDAEQQDASPDSLPHRHASKHSPAIGGGSGGISSPVLKEHAATTDSAAPVAGAAGVPTKHQQSGADKHDQATGSPHARPQLDAPSQGRDEHMAEQSQLQACSTQNAADASAQDAFAAAQPVPDDSINNTVSAHGHLPDTSEADIATTDVDEDHFAAHDDAHSNPAVTLHSSTVQELNRDAAAAADAADPCQPPDGNADMASSGALHQGNTGGAATPEHIDEVKFASEEGTARDTATRETWLHIDAPAGSEHHRSSAYKVRDCHRFMGIS